MVTTSAMRSAAASRCTTRVGMIATYSAIRRASRRSFLARAPRARAVPGDRGGIGAIVLGGGAGGRGERAERVGIDAPPREAGRGQGGDGAGLVAAARLEPDRGEAQAREPLDQRAPAGLVIADR